MSILAAEGFLAHPLVVGVAVVTFTAVLAALIRLGSRAFRILNGIDERVLPHFDVHDDQSIPARLERTAHELTINGGSSVKDTVNRLDRNHDTLDARVSSLEQRMDAQ